MGQSREEDSKKHEPFPLAAELPIGNDLVFPVSHEPFVLE